jgi:hypothetical protein
MKSPRTIRMVALLSLLSAGGIWALKSHLDVNHISATASAISALVTVVYALLTYEILLENQIMAKAALTSASYAERSVRFAHSSNIVYTTFSTKTPDIHLSHPSLRIIENEDYRRAMDLQEQEQAEFVFAAVENKGPSVATRVAFEANYLITDSGALMKDALTKKSASVPLIDPQSGVALCIFISRVPTPDDGVRLSSARIMFSDFYRDAVGEESKVEEIRADNHQAWRTPGGVLNIN